MVLIFTPQRLWLWCVWNATLIHIVQRFSMNNTRKKTQQKLFSFFELYFFSLNGRELITKRFREKIPENNIENILQEEQCTQNKNNARRTIRFYHFQTFFSLYGVKIYNIDIWSKNAGILQTTINEVRQKVCRLYDLRERPPLKKLLQSVNVFPRRFSRRNQYKLAKSRPNFTCRQVTPWYVRPPIPTWGFLRN